MPSEPTEIVFQPPIESASATPRSDDYAEFGLQFGMSSILPFAPLGVAYFVGQGLDGLSILQTCCIYLFVIGHAAKLKAIKYTLTLAAIIGTGVYGYHLGGIDDGANMKLARTDLAPTVVLAWIAITVFAMLSSMLDAWNEHVAKSSPATRISRDD